MTSWGLSHTAWLADPLYKTADEILAFDPRTHDPSSLQQKIDYWCGAWDKVERVIGGRLLTTGTPEQIDEHVKAGMAKAKRLAGFLFCLGGQVPNNVPLENLEAYFDACRRHGKK